VKEDELTRIGLPAASETSVLLLVMVQSSWCSIFTKSSYIRDSGMSSSSGRGGTVARNRLQSPHKPSATSRIQTESKGSE
jgi:hypothetical protein